ncbi:C-1-tetrahydrofolate synthase, cytoplasmic, partial [Geodia barretti]
MAARNNAPPGGGKMEGQDISGAEVHHTLDGKAVAAEIRRELAGQVAAERAKDPTFSPGLAILQVGGREDSNVYIRMKTKAAQEVGITVQHIKLPADTTESSLLATIQRLNFDPSVHGILLQLPLDTTGDVDSDKCTNAIAVEKDVDGLTEVNAGRLARGDVESCVIPCTPLGCLELIRRCGHDIRGKEAVVLGRSKIVGTPMADLLTWNNATVTVCHSKTVNLESVTRRADILVVAIRQPQLVKGQWIKPGAIVIDVGINSIPDSTKKSGQRLVGDVDFQSASKVCKSQHILLGNKITTGTFWQSYTTPHYTFTWAFKISVLKPFHSVCATVAEQNVALFVSSLLLFRICR